MYDVFRESVNHSTDARLECLWGYNFANLRAQNYKRFAVSFAYIDTKVFEANYCAQVCSVRLKTTNSCIVFHHIVEWYIVKVTFWNQLRDIQRFQNTASDHKRYVQYKTWKAGLWLNHIIYDLKITLFFIRVAILHGRKKKLMNRCVNQAHISDLFIVS